jgi:hypothetical protein
MLQLNWSSNWLPILYSPSKLLEHHFCFLSLLPVNNACQICPSECKYSTSILPAFADWQCSLLMLPASLLMLKDYADCQWSLLMLNAYTDCQWSLLMLNAYTDCQWSLLMLTANAECLCWLPMITACADCLYWLPMITAYADCQCWVLMLTANDHCLCCQLMMAANADIKFNPSMLYACFNYIRAAIYCILYHHPHCLQ